MHILYEDTFCIVCVKPVGIASQLADGANLVSLLQVHTGSEIFPIHRLDTTVGGVMVYAKTKTAAAALSAAVQAQQLIKEYLAVVQGVPEPQGVLQDLLFKDSSKNKTFVVKKQRKGVKPASLSYKLLETDACGDTALSLVHIRLHTGRSHQIRVQFASRKHPLLGDSKYGSRSSHTTPALWAFRLTFPHPHTGMPMTFSQLPPAETPWNRFVITEEAIPCGSI